MCRLKAKTVPTEKAMLISVLVFSVLCFCSMLVRQMYLFGAIKVWLENTLLLIKISKSFEKI